MGLGCAGVRWAGFCGLAALLAAPAVAAAEIAIARPALCSLGHELSSRVERALGQPLASTPELRLSVLVVHEQGSLAARLELASPGQPSRLRSFRAPTCEKLTDTLALAVVLAVGARSGGGASSDVSPPGRSPPRGSRRSRGSR
jgi:hypothetical protein